MSSEEDSDVSSSDEEDVALSGDDEIEKLEAVKKVPQDIEVDDEIFDVTFHPTKNVIVSGEITGKICIYSYDNNENKKLFENTNHKKACRNVSFSLNGERLHSCSKDKSIQIIDLNTGTPVTRIEKAHAKAINSLHICENYFTSGSDDGVVKMWDTRTFSAVAEFSDFNDFISDMTSAKDNKFLLCTSGDGVLTVLNLRKRVIEHTSDQLEEELLSLAVMKNNTKVVCGSGDGVLNIYNWGEWGDISDRVPMETESIDVICPLSEDILCTGVGNGKVNGWYLLPHKHIGCVGSHGKLGVQSLSLSNDKEILASAASEKTIKFWDVSELRNTSEPSAHEKSSRKRKLDNGNSKNDFFDEL